MGYLYLLLFYLEASAGTEVESAIDRFHDEIVTVNKSRRVFNAVRKVPPPVRVNLGVR